VKTGNYRGIGAAMGIRLGLAPAVFLAAMALAFAFATLARAGGEISQHPGRSGCISTAKKTAEECRRGPGLKQAGGVVVSPDGRSAYVASYGSNAVAIFDRDPASGTLIQKQGGAGCIAENGFSPELATISAPAAAEGCQDGRALEGARRVVVSPDGKSVYVASFDANAVAIFDRDPATGALRQKAGKAGCISEDGTRGACQRDRALRTANGIVVSPDGKSVYVAAQGISRSLLGSPNGALAVLARDPATGALRPIGGAAGCFSKDGSGGACHKDPAIGSAYEVSLSPDGRNVYVISADSNDIAIFARHPASGQLSPKPSAYACVTGIRGSACPEVRRFGADGQLVVSPDGKSAYVTSVLGAVAIFDRDPATGALRQKAGKAGCVAEGGMHTCRKGRALKEAQGIAISPDGSSLYVTSYTNALLAVFDRDPTTGELTQKHGAAGCVSRNGTDGTCGRGSGFGASTGVTVSPEGTSVYVASAGSGAVAIFDRSE
jgi:DNA-binding beta-propeller fold protein YncE